MNTGKAFEHWIKDSCEIQQISIERLRDAGGWDFNQNTGDKNQKRFTISNICDFIANAYGINLFIEAKSCPKSITFERLKRQLSRLLKKQEKEYKWSFVGYLIEFRDVNYFGEKGVTVAIPIDSIVKLQKIINKKSFNFSDLSTFNVTHFIIRKYTPIRKRKQRLDMLGFVRSCQGDVNLEQIFSLKNKLMDTYFDNLWKSVGYKRSPIFECKKNTKNTELSVILGVVFLYIGFKKYRFEIKDGTLYIYLDDFLPIYLQWCVKDTISYCLYLSKLDIFFKPLKIICT